MTTWSFISQKLRPLVASALLSAFAAFGAPLASAQSLYDPGTITSIIVDGNQRYSDANVAAVVPIRVGDAFDPVLIDTTIKALFETGQFADVRVVRNGGQLVIKVLENLVLDIIAFEGNTVLTDEMLDELLISQPRDPFTKSKVQADVRRMLRAYEARGLYGVDIAPKLITLDNNRANLVFEISEGSPAKIDSIVFIGNQAFSDGQLRSMIQSRQRAPWRFLSEADLYNPDRLDIDANLLVQYYQGRGYADARVLDVSGEQISDRSGFLVTFYLDEGERFRFGRSRIRSEIGGLDAEVMRPYVASQAGQWFDLRKMDETRDDMRDALGNMGYAFANVRVEQENDPATGAKNLTYVIEEGQKVFVERIDIRGNDSTQDYVIRREFRLAEGDAYSTSKLRRSQQRIQSLGYFESVDIAPRQGSTADRLIIDVDVLESNMNQFNFGGTISTQAGLIGNLGVTFGNLGGRGQSLSVQGSGSQTTQDLSLSFSEPWLYDREIPASASLFYNQDQDANDPYNARSFGGRLSLGYKLSENVSQNWSYALRRSEVFNVDDDAPFVVSQDEGITWRSIIGHRVSYDTRDNRLKPREGLYLSMENDFAGLGGDVAYLKNTATASTYFPVRDQATIALRVEAGNLLGLGGDTRISDRFFYGENLVRGFSPDGLTPRCDEASSSSVCPDGVALGGTLYYRGTAEYRFPMPFVEEQGFQARAFADVGSLWNVGADTDNIAVFDSSAPRFSMGVGITWDSPIGPLSVDYGIPFNVQEGDVVQNVRFAVASGF